ncbi:hypothetical protein [Lacimonas salitolerans]|uniref:Polysaccharide biosynthesis enzyme WcbI domain-containing protein n=1 Tax=Lacimonas salitolerans TaxID=1323750 RepID=A0ABW4EH33_9RHOB
MKFVICCPDDYTGGPFALLQLNSAINSLGYKSQILFYDVAKEMRLIEDYMTVSYKRRPNISIADLKYDVCSVVHKDDVIIFPEREISLLVKFSKNGFSNCVLWWLSWDNAPLSQLNRFEELSALHHSISIFQSHYAQREAASLNIDGPIVSDYTLYDTRMSEERHVKKYDICFLPRKAIGTEKIIADLQSSFSVFSIENMSHTEVQRALQASKYFIDFGHHPGKDRIPREAALFDCIPIVRKAGAAKHMEDVYLPNFLKLDHSVLSGQGFLTSYIHNLNKNYESILYSLKPYQRRIRSEFDLFHLQVSDFCNLFFGQPEVQ